MEIRRDINQYAHVDLKHISAFTRDEIFYNLDVIFLLHMLLRSYINEHVQVP